MNANDKPTATKRTNVFGSTIVENLADCPDCHGTGEIWTYDEDYGGNVPSYCKCGVYIGQVPRMRAIEEDDREPIDPGDYHYFNR